MTVEQFFTHYAALFMSDDDGALAAVYAPNFFSGGGPNGARRSRMTRSSSAGWRTRARSIGSTG